MSLARDHNRSNLFIASYQIEGLCNAARFVVSSGGRPGPASVRLLRSLRDNFVSVGSGFTVEHIPQIVDDMDPSDFLIAAEVLKVTVLAFLTPEEAEEQRGTFGFHANSQG